MLRKNDGLYALILTSQGKKVLNNPSEAHFRSSCLTTNATTTVYGGVGTPNYGVSLASLISVLELLMLLPYRCTYEVSKRPHLSSRNVLTQF